MKATKKIVGAACALVAAVALSAGSTFAWFSSNSQVEVTGMKVQAVVPDALFIKKGIEATAANITETSLEFTPPTETTADQFNLNPARLYNGTGEGVTATTATKDVERNTIAEVPVQIVSDWTTKPTGGEVGVPKTMQTIGTAVMDKDALQQKTATEDETTIPTVTKYAVLYTMSLARINDKTDADLNASVEIDYSACVADSNTSDKSYKFIRTAFYTTNGWVSIANTDTVTNASNKLTFAYTGTNAVIAGDFDGNTAYTVQFIVWYDGDDSDCFVNNALTTHGLNVKITYTVTDKTTE